MEIRRHGIWFVVWLRVSYQLGMGQLAQEVSFALGAILRPATQPGPGGEYVGELAGLLLTLEDPDYDNYGPPVRVVLVGKPEHEEAAQADVSYVDISPYTAELLRFRTERPWTA